MLTIDGAQAAMTEKCELVSITCHVSLAGTGLSVFPYNGRMLTYSYSHNTDTFRIKTAVLKEQENDQRYGA